MGKNSRRLRYRERRQRLKSFDDLEQHTVPVGVLPDFDPDKVLNDLGVAPAPAPPDPHQLVAIKFEQLVLALRTAGLEFADGDVQRFEMETSLGKWSCWLQQNTEEDGQ